MTESSSITLAKRAKHSVLVTYVLYAALLTLFFYWNISREIGFKPIVLAIQVLPLLALLPGMLKGAYRSYSWLCFVLLFYFILAVERVFSSLSQTSDYIFLSLVVTLFISAMMTSRWLQRHQKGAES